MKILHQSKNHMKSPDRWCVYSHFDKHGRVEAYVLDAIKQLKSAGFQVLLVSTSSKIDEEGLNQLKRHTAVVAIRKNEGYDFGSYKLGIEYLHQQGIQPLQLLITNDSVFGPIYDLAPILTKACKYDLYGITDSIDFFYHLQSYFIIYNQKVLKSHAFTEFWESVQILDSGVPDFKKRIIQDYEVGGSQFFIRKGFKLGAAFGFKDIVQAVCANFVDEIKRAEKKPLVRINNFTLGSNVTHIYWEKLIEMGCPYLKRELITTNPTNTDIYNWANVVRKKTKYKTDLICSALFNYFGNDDFCYNNYRMSKIVELLKDDGTIILKINSVFKNWATKNNIPHQINCIFDEETYLCTNLDVKIAVENGEFSSGCSHFKLFGHKENRKYKLNRISGF